MGLSRCWGVVPGGGGYARRGQRRGQNRALSSAGQAWKVPSCLPPAGSLSPLSIPVLRVLRQFRHRASPSHLPSAPPMLPGPALAHPQAGLSSSFPPSGPRGVWPCQAWPPLALARLQLGDCRAGLPGGQAHLKAEAAAVLALWVSQFTHFGGKMNFLPP